MTEYETLDEMFIETLNELLVNGVRQSSRDGDTLETTGFVARLADPRCCFVFNPERAASPSYCAAELIWYLSGTQSVDMIAAYAPRYRKYAQDDGLVHGAYGHRWFGDVGFEETLRRIASDPCSEDLQRLNGKIVNFPLAALVTLLKEKPDSRQAVLTCWNAGDLLYAVAGTKRDLPCTLSLQFLVRANRLNMIVTMRSNDVWLGLVNDAFCFCHLQMIVAQALGVGLGYYQHQAGSMHLYERNLQAAGAAATCRSFSTGPLKYQSDVGYVFEKIGDLVKLEQWNRVNVACSSATEVQLGGERTLFAQIAYLAASRWSPRIPSEVTGLMRKAVEKEYERRTANV